MIIFNFGFIVNADTPFQEMGAFDLEFIEDVHRQNVSVCEDGYGKIVIDEKQLITHFDFDQNGEIDMSVYDEFALSCSLLTSMFQGSAGAVQYWFVNNKLVDYSYSRGWEVLNQDSLPTLLRFFRGGSCNRSGEELCSRKTKISKEGFVKR